MHRSKPNLIPDSWYLQLCVDISNFKNETVTRWGFLCMLTWGEVRWRCARSQCRYLNTCSLSSPAEQLSKLLEQHVCSRLLQEAQVLASFIIICEMKTSLVHTVKEIKCSSSPEMSYTILIDHRAEGGRTITWRHPELRCMMVQFKEKEAIRRTICELGGFSSETQSLNASVSERQSCLSWQQSS